MNYTALIIVTVTITAAIPVFVVYLVTEHRHSQYKMRQWRGED